MDLCIQCVWAYPIFTVIKIGHIHGHWFADVSLISCFFVFWIVLSFNLSHLKGPGDEMGVQSLCLFIPSFCWECYLPRVDEDFLREKLVEKQPISHVLLERYQRVIASNGFGHSYRSLCNV